MNGFSELAKKVGKGVAVAADATLLGGAVTKQQRRNHFAELVNTGRTDEAINFATQHGRHDLAQNLHARREQERAQEKALEDQKKERLFQVANSIEQLPLEQRASAFEQIAPGLSQEYGLDEQDLGELEAL